MTASTNNITTIQLSGSVNASNANEFEQQLNVAVHSQSHPILLVDMKEVDFLDSAGLMALVNGFRYAQQLGRRFILCSLAPSIRIMFEITQLDRVFEIFDNQDLIQA